MEAVKSFNQELMSLYDVKPPISKAKMTAITRGAIKAIKFYKHVVQSVEKFILKCKSEYKVPGLYVIDSIVRQSRHQFGSDKDVFAPRFAKNMQQTFLNLFKCPPEDKSKIIRVLNLWQKNNVFQPDVIQPLFDLADPNNPIYKELGTPAQQTNGLSLAKGSPVMQRTPTKGNQPGNDNAHGQTANLNLTDPNVLQQLQQLQRLLTKDTTRADTVHFDKKLLDFDYGDEDDDVNPSPRMQNPNDSISNLLANPDVLRQLQTLQQTMTNAQQPEIDLEKLRKLQEMKQQEEEFDKHLAQTVPNLPFASELDFKSSNNQMIPTGGYYVEGLNQQATNYDMSDYELAHQQIMGKPLDGSGDVEVITLDHDDSRSMTPNEERYKRRRSRSRSRDRRGRDRDRDKRKRSRTRSGSRNRRHRSRSRDRDRRQREKEKEKEKEKDTEKERERKKRGLPVMKKDHLSVCSTTLWVGHLSKLVHQDDLSNTFGEFGDVVSIDLIPPRGCAFIVMLRRQDAARCLNKLKGHVLHGKAITLAWAPGKGVKGKELKDYWEGDLGVSYIPFIKIKEDIDLDALEDGSMIDEDTMPQWMTEKMERVGKVISMDMAYMMGADSSQIDTSQPPPMPGAGLLQPPPPMLPMVSPFQFNNRLLGMNVPPNMMPNLSNMPNIPLGVPPPNMAGNMMSNQMLGINSPFQGANMMAPPQLPGIDNKPLSTESNLQSLSESLMSITQPFGMVARPPAISLTHSQEDNMDIEMEDAEKPIDKPNQIGDHLQQIAGYSKPYREGDEKRDRRDGRRNRSRDRDRDRDHTRRDHRNDRDRKDSRGRDRDRRDERRGRDNRWGDRDRERGERREPREAPPPPEHREERREREKTLNDRLREMAGMGTFDDAREKSRDRHGRGVERRTDSALKFEPPPGTDLKKLEFEAGQGVKEENKEEASLEIEPPILIEEVKDVIKETEPIGEDFTKHKDPEDPSDIPDDMDEHINRMGRHAMEGPPMLMLEGPSDWPGPNRRGDRPAPLMDEPIEWNEMGDEMDMDLMEGPPHLLEDSHMINGPPHMMDGPPHMMEGLPHMMDGPPHMMDGPPHLMDGPPHLMDGPPHLMDGPPHLMDVPPHLMDGPPGAGDMIDGPPFGRMGRFRDGRRDFAPRGMRGGQRPEFFPRDGPRGPMMRGGPGFGPRGPMMASRGPRGFFSPRGPRPRGPFRDFNPMFEGPPEFFRGPGGPPRMRPPIFESPIRRPRFEDRKWTRSDSETSFDEPERAGRRSRWGENQDEDAEPFGEMDRVVDTEDVAVQAEGEEGGTPVYDECPLVEEEVVKSHEVEEVPPVHEEVVPVKEDQEEVIGEGTVE